MSIPPSMWHQDYIPSLEDWQDAFAAFLTQNDLDVGLAANLAQAALAGANAGASAAVAAVPTAVAAAAVNLYPKTGGPLAGAIHQSPTGQFFQGSGAIVNRLADRVFVGPATVSDGNFPNVAVDWLSAYLSAATGGGSVGFSEISQMVVLSSIGANAILAGSRSSDNGTPDSQDTIGVASFAINDNATAQSAVWAYYGEARRHAGITHGTLGMELDVANQGSIVNNNPYAQNAGQTIGIQIASGCGYDLAGSVQTTAALQIQNNGTPFGAGIIVGANAIVGTDGITGTGSVLSMAKGHALSWVDPNTKGITSFVLGNVSVIANSTRVTFDDLGFHVTGNGNTDLLFVPPVPGAVNGVQVIPSLTGTPVRVAAAGADTNVDLFLSPKGAGTISLNVPTATSATGGAGSALPALPAGYASVKIGTTAYKIPYYN